MQQSETERRLQAGTPRPPRRVARLAELEGVRALAALWVFGFHVWQFGGSPESAWNWAGRSWDVWWLIKQGPSGVDLFMVLSGLCLFWPVVSREVSGPGWDWRDYLRRRVRRIVPAYYGAIAYAILLPLALVGMVRALGWEARMQPIPSWWQISTHLLFVHTLFAETWDGITGAFWSMGLEAQFYLLFPVLVWGWNRYRWRALWAAVFASVFYRAGVDAVLGNQPGPERFLWTITFLGRWMQFVTGMMVSYLLVSLSSPAVERIVRWRYGFLAAGGGLVWWGLDPVVAEVPWVPARDLLLSAGYGLLLLVLLMAPWRLKTVFSAGVLGWLGVFSYSFFLIHQPTAWYFMEWVRKRSGVSGAPQVLFGLSVGLVVTAAVAWVFAWIFEGAAVRRRLWVR